MQIIMLLGEPASGKTTLIKKLLPAMGSSDLTAAIKYKEVRGTFYLGTAVLLLGIYDGGGKYHGVYDGTDRLARHTQPQLLELLADYNTNPKQAPKTVLLEGNLYSTPSFLTAARALCPCKVLALDVTETELTQRHHARGDNQTPTWLHGKHTSYIRLRDTFATHRLPHNTLAEQEAAVGLLTSWLVPF